MGEITVPLADAVDKTVEQVTGYPAGNVGARQEKEVCGTNAQKCGQYYELSTAGKIAALTVITTFEEVLFRFMPSVLLSAVEKRGNPVRDTFIGTGGLGMTRRELIVGAVTTAAFGAAHNITKDGKGFDTSKIPASQTIDGAVYWYLQRKFGIVANTFAHTWHNLKVYDLVK